MKFNPGKDTLSSHFLAFDKLIRDLKTTGAKLKNTDVFCHLLLTMPSEYDYVVTAIETLSAEQLDIRFVKNRLLDEEAKRTESNKKRNCASESSAVFSAKSSRKETNTTKKGQFQYRCYNCDIKIYMVGHKRSECKQKKKAQKPTSSANLTSNSDTKPEESEYYCFSDSTANNKNVLNFYLDSGVSEHIVCKNIALITVRKLVNINKLRCPTTKSA